MSTMNEAIGRLAHALKRASDEHGRPNTFGCGELSMYGGPQAMLVGRIGASGVLRAKLHDALGGAVTWGPAPTYADGRWSVSAPEARTTP